MDRSPKRDSQNNVIPLQPRMSGQYRSLREPEVIYLRPHRKIPKRVMSV